MRITLLCTIEQDFPDFLQHCFDGAYHASSWISIFTAERQIRLPDIAHLVSDGLQFPPQKEQTGVKSTNSGQKKRKRFKTSNVSNGFSLNK
jgi:hypothetical protein